MAPAAPAAPAAGPKFTWGGLVDAYYMYLFNPVDGANTLVGAPPAPRVRHQHQQRDARLTAVSLNAAMDPVAFQLDLGYGATGTHHQRANGAASGRAAPRRRAQGSFIVLQAYGTITVLPQLTLDFGKFYTTAGAEVIPANKNWLYSRSILFNIPLLHTGARANFKVNDMLSLQASLVNGWNDDPDVNAWKTVGLSATHHGQPDGRHHRDDLLRQGSARRRRATETPGDLRVLVDVVAALTLSDKLGVNINVDYVKAPANVGGDYFVGGAAMARYVISDHLNVAARGELCASHIDWAASTRTSWKAPSCSASRRQELRAAARVPGRLLGQTRRSGTARRTRSPARWPRSRTSRRYETPVERLRGRRSRRLFFVRETRRDYVSRSRSLSTPAAVTAGPAPGPVITSGFLR